LQDLADPPIETSVRDGGIDVHTKDPARNADRMASLRKALAGRTDLLITPQPDQTLLISFASDIPAVTIGGQDQLIRTVQARVKALQLQPLTITGVPPNGVVVRFATDADASTFKRSLARGFGLAVRMVDEGPSDATSTPPSPGDERLPQGERGYLWLRPEAMLTGDMIADTRVGTNAQTNEPVIDFRLTDEGQRVFAAITSANVGRRFAIVLDGVVLSAPVIQSPILGGSGEINGNFTAESALVLAQSILDHRGDLPLEVVDR
jgi:preprotein translocase subunit SecD